MADSILRLRVQSEEYDNKLKRASQGLQNYAAQCRKIGGTLEVVEKDTLDFVKAIGKMETTSMSAKGKLNEMTKAFVDMKMVYKEMSDAEKASPVGKALSQSLDQLKVRITETKADLRGIEKELGGSFTNFSGAIDMLGQKMGLTGNITELLTSKTALLTGVIGGGTTAVIAATKAWADYNSEIAKQQQVTTVTTGLNGDDADRMTAAARAMAKTYDVDFREAINAANTLMSQFGETGDESISIISDGLQGMIQGDGGKLLSMIQQYAPAFHDAGISASQLVAVINNSEGGIFTDQNMNAIVMGIKNIRLMTESTSEALAKMGIDGQEMSQKMNDGTMTVFDALKQVAVQLENVNSNSKTAGEVMQAVFGRQGVTSGTNLAKAIETLNINLEETKHQTGEVGVAYNELYNANLRLEQALQKTFGYKGWEEMATGIKTTLVGAIANVLEKVNALNNAFQNTFGVSYFKAIERAAEITLGPLGNILRTIRSINSEIGGGNVGEGAQVGGAISMSRRSSGFLGDDDTRSHPGLIVNPTVNPTKTSGTRSGGGGRSNQPSYMEGSLSEQQALVSELTKKWHDAAGTVKDDYLVQLVAAESLLQKMKENDALDKWAAGYNMRKEGINVDMSSLTGFGNGRLGTWAEKASKEQFGLSKEGEKALSEQEKKYSKIRQQEEKDKNKDSGLEKFSKDLNNVTATVSNIANGIEALGIELPEGLEKTIGVIQTISGILTAILAITTAIQATSSANAAASWVDALIPFANGGIVPRAANGYYVPGNSYSGDNTIIRANAGELVLSKAQQGNLASQLADGGMMGNLRLEAVVTGENLRFVLNNNGKRTGRGEYVQTNRR